jgi:CDP-L-myo-inositol myo-inositolphosphotransferase
MKCLIIATEKDSGPQQWYDNTALVPVLGVPLIERGIRSAIEAGADDFYVATGSQGERVQNFLDHLADYLKIPITSLVNKDRGKENGFSVLQAREYLHEPFLLLTDDLLFDPSIARKLMEHPLADDEIIIAIDRNAQNSFFGLEDVTRVKTKDGKLKDIGNGLKESNGVDTGIFLCTPAIFETLEHCVEKYGDASLSRAVQVLAARGQANTVDINGHFWIDVANPAALQRAENALMADLRGKPNDGLLFRYFFRPLSGILSRRLVNYRITPNQISFFSFFCCVLAAGLFALGGYPALLLGGFLSLFAMVIDCCDGAVARLKFQGSEFGGWFDAVLDRYADAFLLFGLMWHAYADKMYSLILFIGFLAIIGSFVLSYTADKYDSLMRDRISQTKGFRVGRELRVFLIFLGALLNQAFFTLILIAVIMNIETIRRVIICRDNG